jgi:hypothetical protein
MVASANTGETEQTAWERVMKLAVDDREVEVTTWTPGAIWPDTGDLIEVALNSDGSRLALDTDERWDGLPGQALVFRAGGAVATEPSAAGDPDGLLATLDQQLATMKLSPLALGKRYERTVRKILDGYRQTGVLDEAAYEGGSGGHSPERVSAPFGPVGPVSVAFAAVLSSPGSRPLS